MARARSPRSMRRPAAARASALVLLLASACAPALAKVEQGTLKIDSVTTEQLIGKFGVAESGDVQLKLTTSRDGWERGRHELHVLFFHDDNYRKWEKSIRAGSLCRDRNKIADIEHKVDLPHELATHHGHGWEYFVDPETGKSYRVNSDTGESEWNSPHNATRVREEGPVNRIHHRETVFSTKLEHSYPSRGRDRGVKVAKATHWYVVVSDCALEFYEAHPPPMRYELAMFNGGSHLPSDLNGMGALYFFALLALLLGAGPAFASARNQYARLGRVHVLVALLGAAYAAQTLSFFLELWHLAVFARDGKGLQWRHTFVAADFAAELSQGFSEFVVAALLLFLACGWTTVSVGSVGARLLNSLESGGAVSDEPTRAAAGRAGGARRAGRDFKDGVVAVVKTALHLDEDNPEVKRRVASVTRALQQPARLVGVAGAGAARAGMGVSGAVSGASSTDGAFFGGRVDAGGAFLLAFAAVTAYLEMASRQFTDDFSAFHDHEHWPGYCLVLLRLCLLTLFLVGGNATIAAAESRDPDAAVFLKKLRAVGGAWLAAFPFLVCTAWCAPSNFRHRYVVGGLAVLQTTAILALAYLCLGSERFLALSTVAPKRASAAGSVAGTRGVASKLAVD